MIFTDLILTFSLGLLFPILLPQTDGTKLIKIDGYFFSCFLYMFVICFLAAVFCYLIAPAWMWFYFLDPKNISLAILIPAFSFYFLLYISGYFIGLRIRSRGKYFCGLVLGFCAFFYLGFLMANFKRFWQIGTLAQFHQGQAVPLIVFHPFHFHPLGLFLFIEFLIAIIWLVFIFRSAKRPYPQWNRKEA